MRFSQVSAFTLRVGTEEGSAADLLLTFVDELEALIAEKQKWKLKAATFAVWKAVRKWFLTQCEHGPQWEVSKFNTWEAKHAGQGCNYFRRFSEQHMIPTLDRHDYIHMGEGDLVSNGGLNYDWLYAPRSGELRDGVASVPEEDMAKWQAGCINRYRSDNNVNFFAHNSSKYDSVLLLRQFIARRARMGEAWKRDVKVLRNHGAFLEVKIGIVTFRDTIRQLPSSLDDLCESFQLSADESKGVFPHAAFKPVLAGDTSSAPWPAPWTDEELIYKPPRRLVEHNVSVGPMGVKLRRPIDEETYRAIPGHDPDGDLHGEGMYNPYQQCLDYCKQDASSLMIIWEKWREGVRQMTEVTGFDAPHEPLVPKMVVAIDPGPKNLGYCVLDADGRVLACGVKHNVGSGIAAVVSELVGDDDVYVIVEDQPKDNKHTFPQMQKLLEARPSTRLVDANYKFALAGKEVRGVTLPPHRLGLGHDANKRWARNCAQALGLEVAGGKVDDAADAFLLAEWFRRTHFSAEGGIGACAACTERWNTHGADPNNYLSIGQLAESMYKTQLVCKPCSDEPQEEEETDEFGVYMRRRGRGGD